MSDATLFPDMAPQGENQPQHPAEPSATTDPPRLRLPHRDQTLLVALDLQTLLPADNLARTVAGAPRLANPKRERPDSGNRKVSRAHSGPQGR